MHGSKVSWLAGIMCAGLFYGSFLSSGTCRQERYAVIVAVKTVEQFKVVKSSTELVQMDGRLLPTSVGWETIYSGT